MSSIFLQGDDDAVGPDNVGGYQKVEALANFLFRLKDQTCRALSNEQARQLIALWNDLSEFDQRPTTITLRTKPSIIKGRFKARGKTTVAPGVESTKRCFLGQGTGPAQKPDSNRYMESLIIKLCHVYSTPERSQGKTVQRWTLITRAYSLIRDIVVSNPRVMEETSIALLEINNATLTTWYNARAKRQERLLLEQGLKTVRPPIEASRELPPARVRAEPTEPAPLPPEQGHQFRLPAITVGESSRVKRRLWPSSSQVPPPVPTAGAPGPVFILPAPQTTQPGTQPQPSTSFGQSRTNIWYHAQQEKRKSKGQNVRAYKRTKAGFTCKKCGNLRTSEKHTQYYGQWYCADTDKETLEEWRSSRKKSRQEKKQQEKRD